MSLGELHAWRVVESAILDFVANHAIWCEFLALRNLSTVDQTCLLFAEPQATSDPAHSDKRSR